MNCKSKLFIIFALMVSTNANSALLERLGGLAYYDDESNLTWLTDSNYAKTSGYDADGLMNWADANAWATGLNIEGITGWRLPNSLQPDTNCNYIDPESGAYMGSFCTGSEMGNLFYSVLENTEEPSPDLLNIGPFNNVEAGFYWTATELDTIYALDFYFINGYQGKWYKDSEDFAWAVHTGDVSAIPLPPSIWLFGSGLFGLFGLAWRKNNKSFKL